jgi:DNA-binding SARP family transcriptional activator
MLRTLGTVGLYAGNADAPVLGAGKPIAFLIYLHALPGRRASREHLLDVLWADLEPTAARHALRQMKLILRQRLGARTLEASDLQQHR